ncbi:unnamed protein product [Brassicogethes aeneus]|uniref:C2H2-type domain-containing protein n=1 Tax=Brassicogethes aeneus TaxID=1431903 RepID=A0A9P0AQZ9_BRAAE|nr:unnamed protein product [Brassicogethes aeneus]
MANRRMGGMGGGPHRGNRSFSQHQPFQGNNVNPWGNSNNSMNPGLISQLTSNPQQLALALSSLLQPQQVNPPSLLSLNTSPGFSNQDRDLNRFGNRGRDFRRHEPYNKNRNGGGGWRPMDNNRNRNQQRRDGPNQNRDRNRSNSKAEDKKKRDEKKPEEKKKEDNADLSVDENNEEGSESKRDWKEEKNTNDEKNQESGDDEEKKDKSNKDGKYFDVPQKFLNCFVCNKEMWDGESMQKHIRGRAHKQMLNSLEESIHCTVKILRENMRLQEEKKVIEVNRMHRLKKFSRYQEVESHCNMCDLKFLGKILAHRKTEGHQRLKRYLHPNCNMCEKEFPSRMEWVEHRLTPEHLRTMSTAIEKKTGGKDGEIIIKEEELDIEPLLEEPLQLEVENPILELSDDVSGLQNIIPAFKKDRKVSTQSLKPFTGFVCELCDRSFVNEDLAQDHLKTRRHYYAFIEAAKKKLQKQEDDKKKEEEEKKLKEEKDKEKKDEETGDMYDPEEACNEEDESAVKEGEEEEVEEEEEEEEEEKPEENGAADESAEAEVAETKDEVVELEEEEVAPIEVKEDKPSPGRPVRKSVARNGAGPKSKKLRPNVEAPKVQKELGVLLDKNSTLSNFRIPKKNAAPAKKQS